MPVAIITGGGAGMGLAVATALVKEGWSVALLDVNKTVGVEAARSLGDNAQFIATDVRKYGDQQTAFEAIFQRHGHVDFVFANAGIAGRADFYDKAPSFPPEEPSMQVVDICFKGVVFTSHLAIHYMRRNSTPGGVIVTTASGMPIYANSASIYASPELPLYAAAKHGVLGLTRSMSEQLAAENIRVNSILPGAIKTTLFTKDIWAQFPQEDFTPITEVVDTVLALVKDPKATGRAMEISSGEVFDRKQPDYSNDTMRRIMSGKSY